MTPSDPTTLEHRRDAARQRWLDLQHGGCYDAQTFNRAALEYATAQKMFSEECTRPADHPDRVDSLE